MRKSVAVSTFVTGFGPIVFSGELHTKLHLIKDLGYDGIDLFIKRPDEPGLERLLQLVREEGLDVVMVAAVSAAVDEGLSLTDRDAGVRNALIERMAGQIALAGKLGAMVPIGLVRGSAAPGEPKSAVLERLAASLHRLQQIAYGHGVSLILEPINRYETNLINSVDDALEFMNDYDLPLRLLLDTFHMNIEEVSIEGSIEKARGLIGHVHFADSNRWSAGMGHLDFSSIVAALRKVGYEGFLSSEVLPLPDPMASAKQAAAYMSQVI
ncbi:MAG: sugar phosphate isomerase/epimerase family protein [Bacillota bacterium]